MNGENASPPVVPRDRKLRNGAFHRRAATCSWVCAVIVFIVSVTWWRFAPRDIGVWVDFFLVPVGIVLGIIGLFGIRQYGRKGILVQSLLGLILNGAWFYVFVTAIMRD